MSRFIVRVVLHDSIRTPQRPDYELLHAAMARRKFTRTILCDDGVVYDLPDGEYYFQGEVTAEHVREIAALACDEVWKDYSVLVTEAGAKIVSYNLKPHRTPPLTLQQKFPTHRATTPTTPISQKPPMKFRTAGAPSLAALIKSEKKLRPR